ncbi:RDD family protein [Streptomyces sp. SJL17-1]|uniref:RDD family protein n=1 Tax=Streptomyces sp. SJL17-1 TaxID=2967223 RepID=UPI002966366A|nr:RDD family protein [Streptomyces sp. SJL17-1]
MATPPGGGGEVPQAGYYPDPSIPGYIRYWNGGAWVPGTSRPAPADGEVPPGPPASAIPAGPILASGPAPAPAAAQPARPEPEPVQPHQPARHQPQQPHEPQQLQQSHEPHQPQQLHGQPYQPQPVPGLEPVRPAASVPAQAQAPAQLPAPDRTPAALPAPDRTPALAPVPTVEETGPVFFDEEPAPAEPASAWQADTSRQTGFGGDRDQKVSWGAPRTPDPRTPADWPVAGAGEPEPESEARSVAPATDPRATGGAARLGGMPVTPIPTPAPAPAPAAAPQKPQPTPRAPRPQPAPQPAPEPAATAAPAPAPAPAPVHQAPATPSWAQQAQSQPRPQAQQPQAQQPRGQQPQAQHPQPQQPQSQDPQQPVVPWKPPVDDLFVQAARAQASARPAGLGRRLIARLIDSLVLGALVGVAAFPFVTAALDHINGKIEAAKQSGVTVQVWLVDGTTSVQFGIALAAFFVIGVLYEALPTAKWGRTLGKKLCGIEVRDIEAHQPPRFGAALRRWLVYSVLGLLAIGVLNVLWCLFDRPWRQCWHDKAARTFVAR